jgi:hypothetical protein
VRHEFIYKIFKNTFMSSFTQSALCHFQRRTAYFRNRYFRKIIAFFNSDKPTKYTVSIAPNIVELIRVLRLPSKGLTAVIT